MKMVPFSWQQKMSAPAPLSTYIFHPKLDHILTVLLGLDLTGPDNLNVEMFQHHGITSFHNFKVLRIGLILFLVTPSVIDNQYQPLSMKVLRMLSTFTNILLLLITLIDILLSIGDMPILVLIVMLYLFMMMTIQHQQQQQQLVSLTKSWITFSHF